jgi:hypothetical protein
LRAHCLVDRCHSVVMGNIQTRPTGENVTAFLESVSDERRRAEGHAIRSMMERVTGEPAKMWGPSIVGFGELSYTNTTGSNQWFVVGFSPRKRATTIYGIHDGYASPDPLLTSLGPHSTGKSCLYIDRLDQVDQQVLEGLIRNAWQSLPEQT